VAFDHLKPKPATRITAAWAHALIDVLNLLYGWLASGREDINVDEVLANYGFFNRGVFVEGKPVLKDGDPIAIYDIFDYARDKIAAAIDLARISKLANVYLDGYGNVGVAIYDDRVGLAKEATLSSVSAKLNALDAPLSTRASETTLQSALNRLDELGKLELLGYTTTPLGANASWTSPVDSSLYTRYLCGSAYADQAGTLYVEQSPDGSNWDAVDSFSVAAGAGLKFSVEKVLPYARVRYVNGASDQTVFRLYVYKRLRV